MKENTNTLKPKGRITGIGGIFFKCQDPEKVKAWYGELFGIQTDQYGALFEFRKGDEPNKKAYLQWSPFAMKSTYFEPGQQEYMINYRVENMETLLERLKAAGVEQIGTLQTFDYGKFAHVLDPEGRKIELWEPVDEVFTESHGNTANR